MAIKAGEFELAEVPETECRMRSSIRCNQAQCYIRLKQDEQALPFALQAVEEDRSYGMAWATLGNARGNLEQFDDAVTCLETALEMGMPAEVEQQTQERLQQAPNSARRKAAGGGAVVAPADGAGEVADPNFFAIDPNWLEDAEYTCRRPSRGCARPSAAAKHCATFGWSSTSSGCRRRCRRRRRIAASGLRGAVSACRAATWGSSMRR